jgi:hypothetical protein
MSKSRFHLFLSYLMRHAWQVKRRQGIRFSKALKHSWKISQEELKGQALPLLTSNWDY